MTFADLPVFGPTVTVPCDDDAMPFVRVRVELVVSREQLRVALAISHAELAGEPALPDLGVDDVRREVEGHLAGVAALGLDDDLRNVNDRLGEQLAGELDAAIRRAYSTPAAPRTEMTDEATGGQE